MAEPSQLVGLTLGHYRITEQIGAGGMGVVYRAHDEQLERDVAVKVLPTGTLAEEAARKRFRKEALALATLRGKLAPSEPASTTRSSHFFSHSAVPQCFRRRQL
jgi:serine/threonine protein kinase